MRVSLIALASLVASCSCFAVVFPTRALGARRAAARRADARSVPVTCGLFDMFAESPETKAAKDAAWREQQEMLERQRNPEKMNEYNARVNERRAAANAADAELKALQKLGGTGDDALSEWQRLKDEGKVKGMDETERDADSSRMGSEGLIADRIDEKLPYIDSGWVDDSGPDFMGEMGKLFGGKK